MNDSSSGKTTPPQLYVLDTGLIECSDYAIDTIVFRVPRTLRSQLEAIDHDPDRVDMVGLSHMHIDHVGNLDQFPAATVIMQRAERDAAFGSDAEELTYIPQAYASLDPDRIQTVVGEHDVFGDRTVVMTPLPGHTPGHQGLLLELPETGSVLLAADIAYSAADYATAAVRPGNVDLEASRRSIEKAKVLEHDAGATVWLHHDLDAQRHVATAPFVYH